MWYVLDGDQLAFWTYGKSQKIVNLRRDPRITALVATGEKYEELRGVSVAGTAEIVDDPEDVLAFGEKVFERYWGPITDDSVREGVRVMGSKRVLIRINADKIVSWDHTKLGGVY
jgi:nitroimidazol reductase NimA-like FMN-containing flavoprotein (pyridoxamine 5'-phosphate oxidase superfamily)